ncbi:YcxB family protein [Streptomyces cinnamoneus]|uniref:YcxB family protein n=1 Tax=Streptomyces cinnamoneus TaxID=53446 RepID=UPI00341F03FA
MRDTAIRGAVGSVTVEYELTLADVRSGVGARLRAVPGARRLRIATAAAVAAFVLATALTAALRGPGAVGTPMWVVLALCGWSVFVVWGTPPRQARALYQVVQLHGRTRTRLDEVGMSSASAQSTQTMEWALFGRYAETRDVFVLLSADRAGGSLTVLPKRAFTRPGDTDRLRALLDSRLPRA